MCSTNIKSRHFKSALQASSNSSAHCIFKFEHLSVVLLSCYFRHDLLYSYFLFFDFAGFYCRSYCIFLDNFTLARVTRCLGIYWCEFSHVQRITWPLSTETFRHSTQDRTCQGTGLSLATGFIISSFSLFVKIYYTILIYCTHILK